MDMPEWFGPALAEARRQDKMARIAAMPRVQFFWCRDWMRQFGSMIGVYWDKDPCPPDGNVIYRRWFLLRYNFSIRIDRN